MSETSAASSPAAPAPARPVLTLRDIHVSYFARGQEIKAVRGVNLTVHAGKTLALVGESGSGKSSVAFAAMRGLDAAGRLMRGSIHFNDIDLLTLGPLELRRLQGSRIAMVYQDPQTALTSSRRSTCRTRAASSSAIRTNSPAASSSGC